jgi:hypothetical protein
MCQNKLKLLQNATQEVGALPIQIHGLIIPRLKTVCNTIQNGLIITHKNKYVLFSLSVLAILSVPSILIIETI